MFDDIPIPPPREARTWYCLKCGQAGAAPEPALLLVDRRYAIGYCECTGGRKNRVSGYKRERVNLMADFAFDRQIWEEQQEREAERKAFDRSVGGLSLKPEDARRAHRFMLRNGIDLPHG